MLRDAVTGRDVRVGARGAVRIEVRADGGALTRLRGLLVADVARRVADLRGLRVLVAADDRGAACAALGIAPADADPGTFAAPEVLIGTGPSWPEGADGTVRLRVGTLTAYGSSDVPDLAAARDAAGDPDPAAGAGLPDGMAGRDPLVLRMVMLRAPREQDVDLTDEALRAAAEPLTRWRARVAEWAEAPSRPMRDGDVADLRQALEGDLDTPAALDVLRRVEDDPEIPPGAKFETFVFADRVLALELPRDIGRR